MVISQRDATYPDFDPAVLDVDDHGAGRAVLRRPSSGDLVEELYPICRCITGDGVRETLEIIGRIVPLEVHEVASGTPVLDWTVPPEWNIDDAYIADATGRRVVDFRACNLHVVSYSVPVAPANVAGRAASAPPHAARPART